MDKYSIQTSSLVEDYCQVIHSVFGVYLDAMHGFQLYRKELGKLQRNIPEVIDGLDVSYVDDLEIFYGRGDPNRPDAKMLHRTTQWDLRARIRRGGSNEVFLGNMCLVVMYGYWEDYYRKAIAESIGRRKNELKSPIMGDLRKLRRSIIHHQGIALKEVEGCEVLKWFVSGDRISVDSNKLEEIITRIAAYLDELVDHQALD
jgi:hypothetical protein